MRGNAFTEPFVALGRELDAAFARAGYAEQAFSQLAVEHVARARLHEHFDLWELVRWATAMRELPAQHDLPAEFGQPPFTLWSGRRFFVSVLVWQSGTTVIHQHAFTGAFQVLHGSSVHTQYDFTPEHVLSEDLSTGALTCRSIERLTRGAVREIAAAEHGIHALFHLEHPSVSLVVRTSFDHRHPIQHTYYRPGVAIWDLRKEPELTRAAQTVRMALRVNARRAEETLADVLPTLSPYDAVSLLDDARRVGDLQLALRLLALLRPGLHEDVARTLDAALRENDRLQQLTTRRDTVRDPTLRYLLAILLNAPTRGHALALAEAYAPERPGPESLVQWVVELAKVKLKLVAGGLPWEPNVFGLPEVDEPSLDALRRALVGEHVEEVERLPFYAALRRAPAFAPLFTA